ncbi:MAG: hypothetical protein ABSE49_04020 [Polyangiaceae bacterium]
MHPSLRMIVPGLVSLLLGLVGGCFDFDATMAGGGGSDSGVDALRETSVVAEGSVDDGPGDATVDTSESAAPESGAIESGVDAGDSGSSGGPFCASLARPDGGIFFCDDFDEKPLPNAWETWAQMEGTLVETDASSRSPPNSVDETTTMLSYGQALNVALRTPLPVPTVPSTLTLAFSLEPLQIDTTANAAIVLGAIDFLDASGYRYTVGLAINVASGAPALAVGEQTGPANGGNYPDGAPPTFVNHPLSQTMPLPMKTWTDLVLEIDWASSGLTGKVTVGGNQELDVPLTMSLVPASLQIGIGTSFVTEYEGGLSPVWELRYDNVAFTATN